MAREILARWMHPTVFTGGGDGYPMKVDTSNFLKFWIRGLPESAVCVLSFMCNSKKPPITKFLTPVELLTYEPYPDYYNVYLRTTVIKTVLKLSLIHISEPTR